jgi:hypothetical protein
VAAVACGVLGLQLIPLGLWALVQEGDRRIREPMGWSGIPCDRLIAERLGVGAAVVGVALLALALRGPLASLLAGAATGAFGLASGLGTVPVLVCRDTDDAGSCALYLAERSRGPVGLVIAAAALLVLTCLVAARRAAPIWVRSAPVVFATTFVCVALAVLSARIPLAPSRALKGDAGMWNVGCAVPDFSVPWPR